MDLSLIWTASYISLVDNILSSWYDSAFIIELIFSCTFVTDVHNWLCRLGNIILKNIEWS